MLTFKAHRISISIFCIAVVLFLGGNAYYYRIDWLPVKASIPALGTNVGGKFTVKVDDTYNVIVEFDRHVRPDYWMCVYGATSPNDKCENVSDRAIIEWSLKSAGSVIDSGTASGLNRGAGWSNKYASSTITTIKARSGQSYELRASLYGPPEIIKETNPRIKIEAPALLHKNAFVITSLVTLLSYVVAGIALIIFLVEHVRKRLARTNRLTQTSANNTHAGSLGH